MGITLGLLGGGGSVLTVPILIYFFQLDAIRATTSSLFVVGFTALFASSKYAAKKEVDYRAAFIFALPSFVGIYLARSIALPMLPPVVFSIADFDLTKSRVILLSFAALMITASYLMLRSQVQPAKPIYKSNALYIAFQGIFVGAVTGFVGAGGGFLILPALVNLLGLRMRLAIGTSLVVIAANSILGFALSILSGVTVDWKVLSIILVIAVIGSFVGAHYSRRIDEKRLKRFFGIFVLVIGTAIAIAQVLGS